MSRNVPEGRKWGGITALVSSAIATLGFIWTVTPERWRLPATVGGGIIAVLLAVGYSRSPSIAGAVQKRVRFLIMLAVAILIPFSKFFLLERSAQLLVASSFEAALILLIVHLSKEWRVVKPPRPSPNDGAPLIWEGIVEDQVGRGPGRKGPDGAPDAVFRLRLGQTPKPIRSIVLRRCRGDGYTRQKWRTDKDQVNWVLGVAMNGERIHPHRDGTLNLSLPNGGEVLLYASDSWTSSDWFDTGQVYEVRIEYADGTTHKEELTIP